MVRRLLQCIDCRKRFVAQSTTGSATTIIACPKCQEERDKPQLPLVEITTTTTTKQTIHNSPQTGQQSCHTLASSSEKGVALLPPTTIDLTSSSSSSSSLEAARDHCHNYSRQKDASDDDSDDEEEDMPLAQLMSTRKSLEGTACDNETNQNHAKDEGKKPPQSPLEPTLHENHAVVSLQQGQANFDNKDLAVCNVCGSCLKHIASWNGRINHLKRCSQQHGVTALQMNHRDDEWEVGQEENNEPLSAENSIIIPKEKPKSINELLMTGARRKAIQEKHKTEAAAKKPRHGGSWGQQRRRTPSGHCPDYKKIPGTDFVVDGFYYAKSSLTSNYFLTHFHSDHYGGLTKSWSEGIIYCSSVTASLVEQQLGVSRRFLHVLPLHQTMTIETRSGKRVKVTLMDANHCPGAVLFFFQIGAKSILHVGDFRWNRGQHLPPAHNLLQGRRLDQIYLDTTYCDPKYTLPTQQEAIDAAVQYAVAQVVEAKQKRQRLLLLFGSYTIGKERIYLAVAKALGMKVYVDSRRYRILHALEWPQEQTAILTKNSEETPLWVVPLGHISMKKLPSYISIKTGRIERRFDRVVGFRPTGWSLRSGKSKSKKNGDSDLLTVCSRGAVTACSVPYSEHSAFPELVDCLACLQPRIIVPTVSVRKSQEQIHLLLEHLENK